MALLEMGPARLDDALRDAEEAGALLSSLRRQGAEGLDAYLLLAGVAKVEVHVKREEWRDAIVESMLTLQGMTAADYVHPIIPWGGLDRLTRCLKKTAESTTGDEQQVAWKFLMIATLNRGYAAHAWGRDDQAVENAERVFEVMPRVPFAICGDASRRYVTAAAYRLRMLGRAALAGEAHTRGQSDVKKRLVALGLEDADRAVDSAEALIKERAPGKPASDQVENLLVDRLLAATLLERAELSVVADRRDGAVADLGRAVTMFDRLVNQSGQRDLTPNLGGALALRDWMVKGKVGSRPR
jgi:hypothetical protein